MSKHRPAHRRQAVSLSCAMIRADDAATALGLTGHRRRRFLKVVAPEFKRWMRVDEGESPDPRLPAYVTFEATTQRVEQLGLPLDDLTTVYEILMPERYLQVTGAATDAMPGSEAKVAVMIGRASRGEDLFHPEDVSLPDRLGYLIAIAGKEIARAGLLCLNDEDDAKGGDDSDSLGACGHQPQQQPQRGGLGPRGPHSG